MATARHPWAELTKDPAAALYLIGSGPFSITQLLKYSASFRGAGCTLLLANNGPSPAQLAEICSLLILMVKTEVCLEL